jgi:hypothetical protein
MAISVYVQQPSVPGEPRQHVQKVKTAANRNVFVAFWRARINIHHLALDSCKA